MIDGYKYPRTMDEAFPGHGDYACAIEVPVKRINKAHIFTIVCLVMFITWVFQ